MKQITNSKPLSVIFLLAVLVLAAAGCGPGTTDVGLGEEFTLAMGESREIRGEDLGIAFIEVLEDSRCPRDVVCIWQGRVICRLQVSIKGVAQELVIEQPGLTDQAGEQEFDGYRLSFSVMPYPEAEATIAPEDYYLLLTVSKAE